MRCGTCRFIDSNSTEQFCRRYPATLINQLDSGVAKIRALFPVVNPDADWCGEYKAAPRIVARKEADA